MSVCVCLAVAVLAGPATARNIRTIHGKNVTKIYVVCLIHMSVSTVESDNDL
jgi:hypothetical protein